MLGNYHFGAVRALLETGLLPHIISGTSAGGVIGAMLCTRTDEKLLKELKEGVKAGDFVFQDGELLLMDWFLLCTNIDLSNSTITQSIFESSWLEQYKGFWKHGRNDEFITLPTETQHSKKLTKRPEEYCEHKDID